MDGYDEEKVLQLQSVLKVLVLKRAQYLYCSVISVFAKELYDQGELMTSSEV